MSLRTLARGTSSALHRLGTARRRFGIATAIFLTINLVFLSLYLWSGGGQTTHVRVVASGNDFAAYVDGQLTAESAFAAPSEGAVVLTVADTRAVPLPSPSGIDSVRVLDLSTADTLFEDDFSSGPDAQWTVSGHPLIGHGVIGAIGEAKLTLPDLGWKDYAVEVTYKNIKRATIMVRAQNATSGVVYDFRTYRQYDNRLTLLEQGTGTDRQEGSPVQLPRTETLKSLLAMTLESYPRVFLFLAAGLIVVVLLQFVSLVRLPWTVPDIAPRLSWFIAAALAVVGLAITLYLNYSYGSHMPHVPDELAYIFQAKLFASAHVSAPPPPVKDVFEYFYPPFIVVSHGKWAGVYPFGHPILLAIGVKLGAIWLIPPLIGAATVVLVFAIGRRIYSERVGLLAALIFVTSPFYLMTASNFMSHNSAAFYLLASLFFLVIAERRPLLYGAFAGLSFGLLFNTQPLSSVAIIPPLGLLMLGNLLPSERRRAGVAVIAAFAVGALLMLGAYFLYNWRTTGDPFQSGLQLGAAPGRTLGFGGENTPNIGIQNLQAQMSFFVLVLTGWPLYIGLMFVLLPFVLASRQHWDWFLLAAAVSALGVYVLFIGNGISYGPRYWYVASPLLILLAARGADRAAEALAAGAGAIRLARWGTGRPAQWAGVLVVYALVAALVGGSIYAWLLGKQTSWSDPAVPKQAAAIRNFNLVDSRLIKLVDDAQLHDALVLVHSCSNWWCYGSVFWLNSPTLDGDVVFALDVPERRDELLRAYPNRVVYLADYGKPSLDRYRVVEPDGHLRP